MRRQGVLITLYPEVKTYARDFIRPRFSRAGSKNTPGSAYVPPSLSHMSENCPKLNWILL